MDIQGRKDHLIELILKVQDSQLLSKIEALFSSRIDWANDLTEEQKKGIIEARARVKAGQYFSSEEVWNTFDAKFKQ